MCRQDQANRSKEMKKMFYEIKINHGYLIQVIDTNFMADNLQDAKSKLENQGYTITDYDEDFDIIYVKEK